MEKLLEWFLSKCDKMNSYLWLSANRREVKI